MKSEYASDTVKEYIADALIALLKVKPLSQITVDELTQTAGVGRATYFRAFNTKQDAITFKLIKMWERYATDLKLEEKHRFDLRNALPFFEYNYSNRGILDTIYNAGLQEALYEAFYRIMMPDTADDDPRNSYREKFYLHGLYGLLDEWIKREYRETPFEIIRFVEGVRVYEE